MDFRDNRSFKVVVMADYFMNPQMYKKLPENSAIYEAIRDSGFGIIKMPPLGIPNRSVRMWVSTVVDQIQEYTNRGFKVAILGVTGLPENGLWMRQLRKELEGRGLKMPQTKLLTTPEVVLPDTPRRLRETLLS